MSSELTIPTLLAVNFGDLIFAAFLLFSFFGWIVKGLQSSAKKNNPQNRQRGERIDRGGDQKKPLQGEIDDFLKDVLGVEKVQQAQEKQVEARRRRREGGRGRRAAR